jgi:hypothetical protein
VLEREEALGRIEVRAGMENAHRRRASRARLAILADALEEAGCADLALLGHLGNSGVDVRASFLLDAILGKE